MDNYDEPIYFTSDIIDMCEKELKGINKKTIADVLKCIITYIQWQKNTDNVDIFDIPMIGKLYRSIHKMNKFSPEYFKTMAEMAYLDDNIVKAINSEESIKKMYGNISKEALESFQNNGTPVKIQKKKPNRLARREKTALRKMPEKYKKQR